MTLYVSNDNAIVVKDLYDPWATAGAGEYIASGTASAQLKDTAGANIGGAITLSYYSSRGGVAGHWWVGVIEEDHAALVVGNYVDVAVTITASTDRVYAATQRHRVERRTRT